MHLSTTSALFLTGLIANEPAPVPQEESAAAPADEARAETVVSGRKRDEPLDQLPASATVIPADQLDAAGTGDVRDAALRVPNLILTEFSSRRLSFPYVRGIGSGIGEPAVVTYVDDVPQFGFGGTNLPLLGVEQVEFLRGPQSLYGRNALGGLIHVRTAPPSPEGAGEVSLTAGNNGVAEGRIHWSGPVSEDGPWISGSGLIRRRDGFSDNTITGNDVDDRDELFGRAQVLWAPSDDSQLRLTLQAERSRNGGFVLSDLNGLENNPFTISQDFEGVTERDVFSPTLTFDHSLEDAEFTSITSLQDSEVLETSDFDFSPIDGVRRTTIEESQFLYQELRLASADDKPVELSDDLALEWVAGASVFSADSDRSAANDFRPGGAGILFPPTNVGLDNAVGQFDDFGYSLYAHGNLLIGDQLEVGAGLRYEYQEAEASIARTFDPGGFVVPVSNVDDERDFDEVLPDASIAFHVDEETTTYFRVAKGFKAGGFNLTAPAGSEGFDPETTWSYELGLKKDFAEGRLHTNLAAFWIDWEDMQLSLFDANSGGFVQNVGESSSSGVEFELGFDATEELSLFASLGWLDTEFKQYVDTFGTDVTGNELPFAPDTTYSLGAQYTKQLDDERSWYVRGEFLDIGTFYYDAGNRGSEAYELLNLRAGYDHRHWGLSVWARNALDENYEPVAFQPSPVDPTFFVGENGAPRLIGATLSLRF